MSTHPEDPGPPRQTRQVFRVTSRGGQVMRERKTLEDTLPVKERPRVIAWQARLQRQQTTLREAA